MPAVYTTRIERTDRRYAETVEEWKLFGTHLPDDVTVLVDTEIGCENFQALIAAGFALQILHL